MFVKNLRFIFPCALLLAALAAAGCGGTDGTTCQDECTAGITSCEGNILYTCGEFDGDGCYEWGDQLPDVCQDGSRQCSGDGFQVCTDTDYDGCFEWGNTQSCDTGQTCTNGECVDTCVDACAAGQLRCVTGQPQYQECVCPAEGCCDWGNPVDCGAGESCSNGLCVSCDDDCTPFGARLCEDNNSYLQCGDFDDDPCNEWSASTDCPQGKNCVNGICTDPCSDECQVYGARTCNADDSGFQTCGNYDTDACLEWGDVKNCVPTEICADGVCVFNCTDECATGEKRCLGNGFQTCGEHDDDPCTDWSIVEECKHNETCSNGVCSEVCQDECDTGAVECSGFQSWRECGEFDHDACRDWGEPQPCALWERCLDVAGPAECVIICFNDCDTPGDRQCAGDGFMVCDDFDWDACLEWSDVVPCDQGELCSWNPDTGQGECSAMPCEDDCDTEGVKECYFDVGYRLCGYIDSDACLDWSSVVECGSGMYCLAGECVAMCQDDCQIGETGCTNSNTRWVCNDADGDGCLDRVDVACPAGLTCDQGVCGADCQDDNMEPNDTYGDSYPLAEGTQAGLVICPGNDDWYDTNVAAGQGLAVTISFVHADGDLDLKLYDIADPFTPIAVSAGISDSESVVVPAAGNAAVYLIWVYGYAGASNQYDLTVEFIDQNECLDDYLEENDGQAGAMFVLDGSYQDLMLCVDDEDWYENYMFAGEDLIVDLIFTHVDQFDDIDLQIVNDAGGVEGSSTSVNDNESLTVQIDADGYYYVRVYDGRPNVENSYSMDITYGTPCFDDWYEPNDTQAEAAPVTDSTYYDLQLCPNDADWYAATVPGGADLLAWITFTHADGDLDLHLYDAWGTQLDYSVSVTDDEAVGAESLAAGTYYIRVTGWSGAENQYDLEVVY